MADFKSPSQTPDERRHRGRFAPSPSGPLHFGSLVAAIGSWLRTRSRNGAWLVRMEDIDPPREVPGAADDILATLLAFGLESDEPVLYQSRRTPAYDAAFERLRLGGHVFACHCSRSDLQASAGLHHGDCVAAADPERPAAWRLRVPDAVVTFADTAMGRQSQNLAEEVGDFVIRRVEGWYAYQLAVVVDDADQGITEVVRGMDLLDSTPRQIYLQRLLGLSAPAYLHLPLVLDESGRKLSKQDRDRPVDADDPIPALREALTFLGIGKLPRGGTLKALLCHGLDRFDASVARRFQPASADPE